MPTQKSRLVHLAVMLLVVGCFGVMLAGAVTAQSATASSDHRRPPHPTWSGTPPPHPTWHGTPPPQPTHSGTPCPLPTRHPMPTPHPTSTND